ncbi:TetR/AcrR family transcriptional regulator [Myceligenerans pegani]|uniref:TetR/AcrR family transcriptional regulator n=1 Tax=Myceligenerans pegani TaxID=2776917 RepID=A0ABR9MYR7_9MICO|nr:TetR/AcrR family transcriptional regulator [Myceligenerans sp. TRM 65318]MBE1876156.1 TetR/AcrR family transcriptional regulator [Myceligenerans sp. TRM 65318]MBE3018427.1 TetR/AcrR family transcriptional regulator [Myceligenerans sp. TRM 65318]
MSSTPRTARALARETLTQQILDAARARLRSDGPAGLSLRAVARDVDMVSSAVYRYFPSRDALLTRLLIDSYGELGETVERADAGIERDDTGGRWLAACRALRTWCVERPGDFALLYGTPIPGYAAPQDTVEPATRVIRVLVRIVGDAYAAGARALPPPGAANGGGSADASSVGTGAPAGEAGAGPGEVGAPAGAHTDVDDLVASARDYVVQRGLAPEDVATESVVRTLMAWSQLFGTVSFELFGHLVGSVSDTTRWYDEVATRLGADLGIPAPA